ncbi:Acg family FMN-binding oxidoreductase [Kitasatospora sp. NPDC052896]|uniref:Acg family FMN-binding oxidoreductase n=1 Tax=Kitasatospora sp. NPDC052896 TaxID=3364061 RepID=UPI0037C714A4
MITSGLDAATLEELVSAAIAAPSMHNTQPWRYRYRPETTTLEVRAVPQPDLAVTDPEQRGLHLSVGAALFNLRLAVRRLGREPVVHLLPRAPEPDLLAWVRLAGPVRLDPGRSELYEAIWRRHSSRLPYLDRPIPAPLLDELTEAAAAEGGRLELPGEGEIRHLLSLTAEAERRAVADPRRRRESRRAIHRPGSGPRGIPDEALGPQDAEGHFPVRDFAALDPAEYRSPVPFEAHPRVAVLSTQHDAPADWLRAGQALERVLLLATARGLRTSLLHQALEWHDLRWAMRDPHRGPGTVQMLIRLGYGPEGAPTPRAAAADALDTDPEAPA